MSTQRELKVNYIRTINVNGKPMQLSSRKTKKGLKFYLHFPMRIVTVKDEISADLCLTLLNISIYGKNN